MDNKLNKSNLITLMDNLGVNSVSLNWIQRNDIATWNSLARDAVNLGHDVDRWMKSIGGVYQSYENRIIINTEKATLWTFVHELGHMAHHKLFPKESANLWTTDTKEDIADTVAYMFYKKFGLLDTIDKDMWNYENVIDFCNNQLPWLIKTYDKDSNFMQVIKLCYSMLITEFNKIIG